MLDDSGSKRYQSSDLFEPEASKIFSNNLRTVSKCVVLKQKHAETREREISIGR